MEGEDGEEGRVVRDGKKVKKVRRLTEKRIDQLNVLPKKFQGEKVGVFELLKKCIHENL